MLKRTLSGTTLKRFLLSLIFLYIVLIGGTYEGILEAQDRLISIILVGLLLATWVWARRRWTWHRTPLDLAILIWGVAFALALVTNLDAYRRILLGLWYMGIFIGAWYLLQDMITNRALKRDWLVDALLIAGAPVLIVGFAQVEIALSSGLTLLHRPVVSTLSNANTMAAFLVMLVPFSVGRCLSARAPLARMASGIYSVAALLLIGLSFSRGGWVATAAALATWASLSFPLRRWWTNLPRIGQVVLAGIGVVIATGVLYVIIESFGIGGRGIDLRTWIYETALQMFGERPIAGYGLFTFGAGLARINSLPPNEPHSHAHNIILNVAAELGIVGLIALALTAWVVYRALLRARKADPITIMGLAAFVGFAVHQMFDLPAMMPTIALVALVALVLIAPAEEKAAPRARWQPALLAVGGIALVIVGLWNSLTYTVYAAAVSSGFSGNFRAASDAIQPLADSDPGFALYPQQQGMLLGLAAAGGDIQAAAQAVEKFTRYTQIEPNYAAGWANLAVMDEAASKPVSALDAMRHAAQLAPDSWSILYRFGSYAEADGDTASAQQAYQQAVNLGADIILMPDWNQSPLRRAMKVPTDTLTPVAQTLLLLEKGDKTSAQQCWTSFPDHATDSSRYHVISLMIALTEGNHDQANAEAEAAQLAVIDINERAWAALGAGLVNPAFLDQAIDTAKDIAYGEAYSLDWEAGANVNYVQYMSLAIPRQFLPQVGYSEIDPALLQLLGAQDALTKVRATLGI